MLPCSLWPLLALALGGSPHAPHPHFGAPESHGHDPEGLFWDHAAIWGAQEAREQRELPPEESRRRLGLLVGLMDSDSSGAVAREELRAWILRRHRGSRQAALRSESARLDRDSDGLVTWQEFRQQSFGDSEGVWERERLDRDSDGLVTWLEFRQQSFGHSEDFGGSPDPDSHRKLLERSRRRFGAADEDGDGRLEPPELDAFLHPEDFPRLQDLVVQETMEELDRDGNGFIEVHEFIADLFEGPPGSPEPPEIQREREQFLQLRDRDGDGRLGPAEVKLWLSPPSPDWAGVEAEHLIHHADLDQDGALSREEILARWELFVGSRATDYGQDLHRGHDEL